MVEISRDLLVNTSFCLYHLISKTLSSYRITCQYNLYCLFSIFTLLQIDCEIIKHLNRTCKQCKNRIIVVTQGFSIRYTAWNPWVPTMNSEAMDQQLKAAWRKFISFRCVYIKIKHCIVEQEGKSLLLKRLFIILFMICHRNIEIGV